MTHIHLSEIFFFFFGRAKTIFSKFLLDNISIKNFWFYHFCKEIVFKTVLRLGYLSEASFQCILLKVSKPFYEIRR